jgi:hypothetical protein
VRTDSRSCGHRWTYLSSTKFVKIANHVWRESYTRKNFRFVIVQNLYFISIRRQVRTNSRSCGHRWTYLSSTKFVKIANHVWRESYNHIFFVCRTPICCLSPALSHMLRRKRNLRRRRAHHGAARPNSTRRRIGDDQVFGWAAQGARRLRDLEEGSERNDSPTMVSIEGRHCRGGKQQGC